MTLIRQTTKFEQADFLEREQNYECFRVCPIPNALQRIWRMFLSRHLNFGWKCESSRTSCQFLSVVLPWRRHAWFLVNVLFDQKINWLYAHKFDLKLTRWT